jgi:replication-associated recombination protein RarA
MNKELDNLLLHPKTRIQVNYIIKNTPQSLLLSAGIGSGKKTLAKNIAANVLELTNLNQLANYPYYFHVSRLKNKSDISIEQIRTVNDALKLKIPGSNTIRRVAFIEDGHFMSIPAQNALLKKLEEPNTDTVFLISTTSVQNVLPTIASRTQVIEIQPVSLEDALNYWKSSNKTKESISSAWRLSGGNVGLLSALLEDNTDHPLKLAVDDAKVFLRASKYERLLMVDKLSRNKDGLLHFFEAMSRMLNFLNHAAVKNGKERQAQNLLKSRKIIRQSTEALYANTNSRLVAINFVINLKI